MNEIEVNSIHESEIYYYLLYGNIADNTGKVNLDISDEFKNKLKEICSNYIGKVLNHYPNLIEYNQIGSNDGDIEVLNLGNSPYNEYYNQEWFDNLDILYTNTDDNIEDFTYFIIKLAINNQDIFLFRKPQKPKAIKKKFILRKVGREYVIDDSNLIIFDDDIDFIVYQNKMYIFKHHSVDAAFNMTSVYRQKSREILSASIIEEKIDNHEQLKDDIENNISFMKRVSKLESSEHKFLFLENIQKTREINNKFDLGLNISDEKVYYEDKSQASHLIAFMQDAYYSTLIGEEIGTDLRRG